MLTLLAFARVAGTDTFLGLRLVVIERSRVSADPACSFSSPYGGLFFFMVVIRGDRVKPRAADPTFLLHLLLLCPPPSFFSLLFSSSLFWAHRYASMASLGVRISVSIFYMLSLICDWADR